MDALVSGQVPCIQRGARDEQVGVGDEQVGVRDEQVGVGEEQVAGEAADGDKEGLEQSPQDSACERV